MESEGEDHGTQQIKARMLCFAILPPETIEIPEEYTSKVELLLQYLAKSPTEASKIKIVSDTQSSTSSAAAPLVFKLFLRGPKHENPKWIYVRLDGAFHLRAAYHIQVALYFTSLHFTTLHFTSLHLTPLYFTSLRFTAFNLISLTQIHWLVCDSWLIEDWISGLLRRCTACKLRITQTPHFFRASNLQVWLL